MATRTTMNVSMTPALGAFVEAQVSSGRFQSTSEVVRTALRLLQEREEEREHALAKLRADVQVGFDQLRRGEFVDGETAFREVRERLLKDAGR